MTDERITAYLLEELTEQESEQFEEQCFAQDEWPAELDAAEQELIDAYLRNELPSDRRRRFLERYLTTDARKARVLATKSFHETLCAVQPKSAWKEWLRALIQRPLVPQTAIALLVLVTVVAVVLVPRSPKTFTQVELAMSSPDRGTAAQTKVVSVPLRAEALQIHLVLPQPSADVAGYRVTWENVDGPLRELKIDSHTDTSAAVSIPANQLKPGHYILRLSDKNGVVGNYYFDVEEAGRTR